MRKIIVSVKMQKTTMKNNSLEMDIERTFDYPTDRYRAQIKNEWNSVAIYDKIADDYVLIVSCDNINYVEVVDEEEELKNAFMD